MSFMGTLLQPSLTHPEPNTICSPFPTGFDSLQIDLWAAVKKEFNNRRRRQFQLLSLTHKFRRFVYTAV